MKSESLWQFYFPGFSFIASLGTLLIWYIGGQQVVGGELQLGSLLAFASYLGMLFGPLQWLSQMIGWTSRAVASSHRIFEIMDTPSEVSNHSDAVKLGQIKGDVSIRNVTYGYEKHYPVLKNINLDVKSGEMIGLVGHSGAGKSTFINLLCRFYDVDEATASVDTETERQIQEAFASLVKGRTTFAIAHRLSTLRNADRLVVLDRGKIVEVGTQEQLLEKQDGVYKMLVEAQQEISKIKGVEV